MILQKEYLTKTTCCFVTPLQEGGSTVGTGIFMGIKPDATFVYVVTATHVANATNNKTHIIIGEYNKKAIPIPLIFLSKDLNWTHHPQADLSILKINLTNDNYKYFDDRCLPVNLFNLTKVCVQRDCELTSIGFPLGYGLNDNIFNPLSFRSFASSSFLVLNRADTNTPSTFFCLENPTIGGYSGCPIFDLGYIKTDVMFLSKDKTICHGFTHGTTGDANGRMALITPAFYLADII